MCAQTLSTISSIKSDIINIQPTVKVSCPVGYATLSPRVELIATYPLFLGLSESNPSVNDFRIHCVSQISKD